MSYIIGSVFVFVFFFPFRELMLDCVGIFGRTVAWCGARSGKARIPVIFHGSTENQRLPRSKHDDDQDEQEFLQKYPTCSSNAGVWLQF